MKRFSILMIILLLAGWCLPMTATAHPGNTDGGGGHYNRSSGKYHYHHGHSEHKHKDKDGDGILDYCPYGDYNFDTQKEKQPETQDKSNSNVLLGKIIIACSALIFILPVLLEKEPLWDQITRFLGYIIPAVFITGILSMLTMVALLPFGTRANAVANSVLRMLFPISVCIYITWMIVSYKMEKEKIETAEVCIFLIGVCHIIFELAMIGVITMGLGWSLFLAFVIFSIAWIMEVVVHNLEGVAFVIGILMAGVLMMSAIVGLFAFGAFLTR